MEIKLQGKYAHTANMLLKQLRTKEITLKEYLIQCAYWGVKTMDDLYFRSLPSRPMEVIEYEQLPYYKKNKLTQAYYEDNPGVTRYYEDKEMIARSNKDSLHWLKVYKGYIPKSDVKSHKKLDEAILDFEKKKVGYNNVR